MKPSIQVLIIRAISISLSFLLNLLLAMKFGSSAATDAFFIARIIPITLITYAAMSLNFAFMPAFIGLRMKGEEAKAYEMSNSVIMLALLISGIFVVMYLIFSPLLMRLITPGFNIETLNLTISLTGYMSVASIFIILYVLEESIINSHNKFIIPALSTILVPAGMIITLLFMSEKWGIYSVVIGMICGYAVQTFGLLHFLYNYNNFKLSPQLMLKADGLSDVWLRLKVIGGFSFLAQLNLVVDRFFASYLGVGAVSALGYAFSLYAVLPALLSFSIGRVIFPKLSEINNQGGQKTIRKLLMRSIIVLTFGAMPLMLILLYLAPHIISLFLQYGNFNADAVKLTASALRGYSIGLVASLWDGVLLLLLYSLDRRSNLLIRIAFLSIPINAFLDYILMQKLGVGGIALASAIITYTRVAVFLIVLQKVFKVFEWDELKPYVFKIGVATMLSGFIFYPLKNAMFMNGDVHSASQALIGAVVITSTYILFSYILNTNEVVLKAIRGQ